MIARSSFPMLTAGALTALILLCLAWELWLAPLRPGGSMLALKAFPLVIPIFGVLRETRYTYQWSSLLVLAYFAEGCVRAFAETGFSRSLALAEIALALICFFLTIAFARASHDPAAAGEPRGRATPWLDRSSTSTPTRNSLKTHIPRTAGKESLVDCSIQPAAQVRSTALPKTERYGGD